MTKIYNTANGKIHKPLAKNAVVNGTQKRDDIKLKLNPHSKTDVFAGAGNDKLSIKANHTDRVGMWGYDGNDDYKFKGSGNKDVRVGLGNSTRNGKDKLAVQSGSKNNNFNINVGNRAGSNGELIDERGNKNNKFTIWDNGQKSDLKATFKGEGAQVNGSIAKGNQNITDKGKGNAFNLSLGAGQDQVHLEGKDAHGTIKSGKEGNATITIKDGAVGKEGLTVQGGKGDVVQLQDGTWEKVVDDKAKINGNEPKTHKEPEYIAYKDSKGNTVNIQKDVKVLGAKDAATDKKDQIISTEDAKKLIDGADGLVENSNPDWKSYPQRDAKNPKDAWDVGFDKNYQLKDGKKGTKAEDTDHALNFKEKQFAAEQLKYDNSKMARDYNKNGQAKNSSTINKNPISIDQANKAGTFLGNLFWNEDVKSENPKLAKTKGTLKEGLDTNNDNIFSKDELNTLAARDGDASSVSQKDFDLAFAAYSKTQPPH